MPAQLDLVDSDSLRTSMVDLSICAATTTWVFYDYILTFSDEIRHMWSYKATTITTLLFLLRYGTLFKQVLLMSQFLRLDPSSNSSHVWCDVFVRMRIGVDASIYIVIVALASLRIYAVSIKHNIIKAFFVLAFGFTFVICNAYAFTVEDGRQFIEPALPGCLSIKTSDQHALSTVTPLRYVGITCMLVCELLVQVFTWERTFSVRHTLKSVDGSGQNLVTILLRDGTIVYISFVIWGIVTQVSTKFDISNLTIPGLDIAICRIILRIRQIQQPHPTQRFTTANIPPSQMLDTTQIQMYLSDADDEDAIHGGSISWNSDC